MTARLGVTFVALLGLVGSASADKAPPPKAKPAAPAKTAEKPADKPADGSAAGSAAEPPPADVPGLVHGPKLVDLGHNMEIDLPAGLLLLERAQAQEMLKKGGDEVENVVAAIGAPDKDWLVILEYQDIGYIDDDDADKLDAGELLQSYKDGTTAQNVNRRASGVPELFVDGWSENPRYEKAKHHLVWGLKAHSTEGPVVNYFTRILGRGGFLSVNLIDKADKIESAKVDSAGVLQAARFKPGFAYQDHKSDDKSSGMGLRALVLGGAGVAIATKGGFLIKLILIFKKAIIFIVVGVGGFFKWLFGRKKKEDDYVPTPPPTHDDSNTGPPPSV